MPGSLFVVATPIGNLSDLSPRAKEVLASVSIVACEDTRHTGKLLSHFGIATRKISYHEHNEERRAEELLARLEGGDDVALVSDAGTPLVSDPGYRLVHAAREAGIPIRAVPGPSALLSALAVSGLPPSPFTFFGFPPARGASRKRALSNAVSLPHTFVFFESPQRAPRLVRELAALAPERPACVMREMTKRHEEQLSGTLSTLADELEAREALKGEVTLVVGAVTETPSDPVSVDALGHEFEELRREGLTAREASKRLAKAHRLAAREVYQRFAKAPR